MTNKIPHLFAVGLTAGLLCQPTLTNAASTAPTPNYVASELAMPQNSGRPFFADMDGDGAVDALMAHWSPELGREIYIYIQQSNGKFPSKPSRIVEVKQEIIAVTTAELGNNPGDELIFITSDAVYSFSSAIASYSGNIQKIVDWPFIASAPNRKTLSYFGELPDINNDGNVDLLLPYNEGIGIFLGNENGQFTLNNKIKTIDNKFANKNQLGLSVTENSISSTGAMPTIDEEGNIVIELSNPTNSEFVAFLKQWQAENNQKNRTLLQTNESVPGIEIVSIKEAIKSDILFLNEEDDNLDQLKILSQAENGRFNLDTDWQGSVDNEGRLRVTDFTGDGLADVIRIVPKNKESTILFYQNKAGNFTFETPDQVLRFPGFEVRVDFSDLNNDTKPDLHITYTTIPVLDMIRDIRIQRTQLFYINNIGRSVPEEGIFNRKPSYKLEEKISPENVLALNTVLDIENDINNDQQKDYLHISGDGTLQAKSINSETLQISDDEFWQYVPDHTILNMSAKELNGDSAPDLILYHARHFTILSSRP